MFRKFKNSKVKLIIYAVIVFISILTLFGGVNIYKSCRIINNQANTNLISKVDGIKKSLNHYFSEAEEETEQCKKVIELTIDDRKFNAVAPFVSKYDKNKIPYIQDYIDTILKPVLLYSVTHVDGLVGIYFNFDYKLLIHKELIGLWYVDLEQNKRLTLMDSGLTSTMLPENLESLKWFYVPKKLKKGVWSEPYIDEDLKIDMITYSTPVYKKNTFLGIMGVDISMEKIRDYLLKFKLYKTGKIYLIDKDNKVIIAKSYKSSTSTSDINKNLNNFLSKTYLKYNRNDDLNIENLEVRLFKANRNIYATTKLYNGFILVAEIPASELYGEINKFILFTSFSLILAVIISVLTAMEAYAKVKKINNELMHKEKLISVGTMAAGIAHEINNPLGYLKCNIDTLKLFVDKIRNFLLFCEIETKQAVVRHRELRKEFINIERYKSELKVGYVLDSINELIEESEEGIKKVSEIVINLKNFSKADNQNDKTNECLETIVNEALKILNTKIGEEINVIKRFDIIPPLYCNKNELVQVMINMIDNACHSVKEKENPNKKIILSIYKKGQTAYFEIEDNGTGMRKSQLNRVFDAFYTTKSYGEGTGLGLSISYEIIANRHDGEILVESKKNKGTKFIIKIPYKLTKGEKS